MSWLHSRFTATAKRSLQQRSPSGRRRRTQLQVEPMEERQLLSTWPQFQLAPTGSASTASDIAAVSRIPGSMEVWWIAKDGSVQDAYWYAGQPWRQFQLAPAGSASTSGGIAAVSRIPGSMEVWWVGPNGSVQDAYWYDGQPWRQLQVAPAGSASTSTDIAAVSRIPGSMEVWWVGPNGSVQDAYWYNGQPWRQLQVAPAGSASTSRDIAAVSRIPGSMEVWWVGPNGSVQDAYWYDGQPWRQLQVAPAGSASTSTDIAAVSRIPGSMEVWWVGPNGSVQDAYWYAGQPWRQFQLAPAGSASTSTDIAAVSRIPGSMEVWWVCPNGSVQDAYWYAGQPWQQYQMAPAGSASTSGGIAAVSRIQNSMEVWWVGPNGSVQDAYWYLASGVALANPAAATGYSPAPAGVPLFNNGGPSYLDVEQGAVGDCWLMASLAEVAARDPQDIRNMFTYDGTTVVNGATVGLYSVRFFRSNGSASYVEVDTELPSGGEYYDHVDNDLGTQVLWVALAEKAYAVANGLGYVTTSHEYQDSYNALDGGWPSWALQAITGRPAGDYSINSTNLVSDWNSGDLIVLCTSTPTSSFIVGNHCYAVVGYNAASSLPFEEFNPWGTDSSGWAPWHSGTIYGLFTANAAFISQNFTTQSLGTGAINVDDLAAPANELTELATLGDGYATSGTIRIPRYRPGGSVVGVGESGVGGKWCQFI